MSRFTRSLLALVLPALPLAPACDNHRPLAPLRDGGAACEELVAYCEEPAAALGEPYQACFETGEDGHGNACLRVYDGCIPGCIKALDALPEGGAGGEGGEGGDSGTGGGAAGQGGAGGA